MYQQYFVLQFVYGKYKQNSEWIDTVIQTWLFKIQNDRHYCVYQIYVCMKIMRLVSHESHGAFGLIYHFPRSCREEEKCYSSRHPTLRVYNDASTDPCLQHTRLNTSKRVLLKKRAQSQGSQQLLLSPQNLIWEELSPSDLAPLSHLGIHETQPCTVELRRLRKCLLFLKCTMD